MPADMIPALLDEKPTGHEGDKKETTTKKRENKSQKELLDESDLAGLEERSDMDLGKTSLVKHSFTLTDNTLFKECYQ